MHSHRRLFSLAIRYIQRRLRRTPSSEDEEYVARGYGRHGGHQHIYSGHTYNKPVCVGEGCGGHSGLDGYRHHSGGHHVSHQVADDYKNWQHNHHPHSVHVNKRVADDYKNWKNGHHSHSGGHHDCEWGDCDEDEAKVLDNFFDDYDKKDIKVIANFLRSDAYEDYVESEDYN